MKENVSPQVESWMTRAAKRAQYQGQYGTDGLDRLDVASDLDPVRHLGTRSRRSSFRTGSAIGANYGGLLLILAVPDSL